MIEKELQNTDEAQSAGEQLSIVDISKAGYQLLKENKIEEAIDKFAKILTIDENNNFALVGMGDAMRKKGLVQKAIDYYQKCLKHHSENNYALFGLADCLRSTNQLPQAITIWEKYLLQDKQNVTVLTRIADAYRKVRNFSKSNQTYQKVLLIDSNNPYAIIGLGHLYYDFKDYKEALVYWERMIKDGFKNVDIRVLTSIGNCHRKLKSFSDGVKYFEAALELDADNFYALFGLADCHRALKNIEESLKYWEIILEQDPKNKMILTRTGDAYRNLNELDKAKEFYERALDIDFDTYATIGLALIAKQKGNYEESIDSFKSLIQQDQVNYRLYAELADCYVKIGDKTKAAEIMEKLQNIKKLNLKTGEV